MGLIVSSICILISVSFVLTPGVLDIIPSLPVVVIYCLSLEVSYYYDILCKED